MLSKNHKKLTTLALCGVLSLSILGTSMSVTEASSHKQTPPSYEREHRDSHIEKHHRNASHHEPEESNKKYSEGERNTAAIVGALVGYAIGKVT